MRSIVTFSLQDLNQSLAVLHAVGRRQGSSPQILRPGQSQNRGGRTPKTFAAQALRHRRVCAMVALQDPPMCTLCAPQARPTWWRGSRLAFSAAILVSDVAGCKCCVIGKVLLCLKHKRALLALTYRRFCGSLYPVYYSRVLPLL